MGKRAQHSFYGEYLKKKEETEAASVHCGGACSFCGSFRALVIFVVLIVVFSLFFLGVVHFFFSSWLFHLTTLFFLLSLPLPLSIFHLYYYERSQSKY